MKIQQIRNATLKVEYAGKTFLIDPMLAEQGAYPGLEGTPNSDRRNPTVGLNVAMNDLLEVDAVIVTHTHFDHWDDAARQLLPKQLPVFVQHDADAQLVASSGFSDVRLLSQNSEFEGVKLVKTSGQHGSDQAIAAIGQLLGEVSGVVFQHPAEKPLYLAGDTLFNDHVRQALEAHRPEVIILNCGDAQLIGLGSIVMNAQDVLAVHRAAPHATLIATHMEAVNHAVLSRADLRAFAAEQGFAAQLLVPDDGQTLTL
ncbi:L-ascorbate metabolism protein UlaG (beta-lactamase superfamily) [Deinobacterium chartae]|uniref:L-ascorbate metabolism protein UlaG (Beta-lactamase superfamily) n=1 Tax=Deinobacterium chartae TaxID=521158 RepID=A0A841HZH7_9DEIO|nr:MBL fold metallo-hydrolase [Deinobacterium chartae]MBB6098074.1 L-ascorbate metabolism protein UlaG (beta-lactamase superfamily) [Deinobacterium chartae]